jgi:hypothetical protein
LSISVVIAIKLKEIMEVRAENYNTGQTGDKAFMASFSLMFQHSH